MSNVNPFNIYLLLIDLSKHIVTAM